MTFAIEVTGAPGSTMQDFDKVVPLDEPRLFNGFRTRTYKPWNYGWAPEVVLFNPYRHSALRTWATKEAAERNVARLAERGYAARVIPAPEPAHWTSWESV